MRTVRWAGRALYLHLFLSLFLCLGLAAGAAGAGLLQWQCHGPYPGDQARVAATPEAWNGVFAGQRGGGVARMTVIDFPTVGYHDWTRLNDGLPDLDVTALGAIEVSGTEFILWAGTPGGLMRGDYTPGDCSWAAADALGARHVLAIATRPDPAGGWIVYAGCADGTVFAFDPGGAADRTGNLPGTAVHSLAVHPNAPGTVFAGLADGSIYRTTDGGGEWTVLVAGDGSARVAALAVNPRETDKVYAGYDPTAAGGWRGVWRSLTGGAAWTKTALEQPVYALAFDTTAPDILYAGSLGSAATAAVYRTTNEGAFWTPCDGGILDGTGTVAVVSLAFKKTVPKGLFAGTADGAVLLTRDDGATWDWHHTGLAVPGVPVVAAGPAPEHRVYARSAAFGVWISDDNGWTWWKTAQVGDAAVFADHSETLAVAPVDGAAAPVVYTTWDGNLYRSDDGGTTWVEPMLPSFYSARCVAVDPAAPNVVFAGGIHPWSAVIRSTDWGESWMAVTAPFISAFCLTVDPTDPLTLYAGGAASSYEYTLQKSVDGGATWTFIGAELEDWYVHAMAVRPDNPQVLLAGIENGGLYRSWNGGATWSATATGLGTFTIGTLAIEPEWPVNVLIGTESGGVYRSTHTGSSVYSVNTGLNTSTTSVTQLVYHTDGSGRAFAATDDCGVFFRHFLYDLNLDELFNYLDLWELRGFLSEDSTAPAAGDGAADVNRDGRVNVVDLVRMRIELD
ncbi:MAG TPA: dockerin type I domain-containing protein [Acidobacteriota bacterium]|nr:dockerin type I domain-containing protein [Acidobacteriota bacterium]HQM65049.1 dockerin type I domain-containing protein [Acidobacteriota bacterium]